ncbi:nuclear transport factor 2 family protein [Endozoicomonadaceae bacterium StTr2]
MEAQAAEDIVIQLLDYKAMTYLTGQQDSRWSDEMLFWNSDLEELKNLSAYKQWHQQVLATRTITDIDYAIASIWHTEQQISCASHWAFHLEVEDEQGNKQDETHYFRATHVLAQEDSEWKVKHLQATEESQPDLLIVDGEDM